MDCKMCDSKTSIRHLLIDGSYCEECECGWVSDRYILNGDSDNFVEDASEGGYWISIEKSEDI